MPTITLSLDKKKGFRNWLLRRKMPKNIRTMLFTIHEVAISNVRCSEKYAEQTLRTTGMDYIMFRCMLSHINNKLLTEGVDMKLPRYWGLYGEYPEWNIIMEIVNKWGYQFDVKVEGFNGIIDNENGGIGLND